MMIYQASVSRRQSFLDRLRSIPLSVFSRLVWPVMKAMMPKNSTQEGWSVQPDSQWQEDESLLAVR